MRLGREARRHPWPAMLTPWGVVVSSKMGGCDFRCLKRRSSIGASGGARALRRGTPAAIANQEAMSTTPRHVYLLHGEEDLLIDQALATLLDRLVPPEERALNLDVVWPDEMSITDLITRLDTLPFFGQRRVVRIPE